MDVKLKEKLLKDYNSKKRNKWLTFKKYCYQRNYVHKNSERDIKELTREGNKKAREKRKNELFKTIGIRSLNLWREKTKRTLIKEDGCKCKVCGEIGKVRELTIDHIKPLFQGGTSIRGNLQLICEKCDMIKNKKEAKELELQLKNKLKKNYYEKRN